VKLLAIVQEFAGKPILHLNWDKEALFFSGNLPKVGALITLEFPGLKGTGDAATREWLIDYHGKHGRSGEHTDIPDALWRPTVLDDVLDARNGGDYPYHLTHHFTLREFSDFAAKHGPALLGDVRAAVEVARKQRAAVLRKLEKRVERIGTTVAAGCRRLPQEVSELELEDDRESVANLGAFDATTWIEACAALKSHQVRLELLERIAEQLVETGADIAKALEKIVEHNLHRIYTQKFWSVLAPHVSLAANVMGEAYDLTRAHEVTVTLDWNTWKGTRVGPLKVGRTALLVNRGNEMIYVRGERKLLHLIRSRGGSITRWGCTLVIGGKNKDTVQAKLLEVDRIDTLAQVDPKAAAKLAGEALPDTHPITGALVRAQTDPTWRRILADLLIERLVGIDADVARRLARTQARANRRGPF
jgi:hypothetical protein